MSLENTYTLYSTQPLMVLIPFGSFVPFVLFTAFVSKLYHKNGMHLGMGPEARKI